MDNTNENENVSDDINAKIGIFAMVAMVFLSAITLYLSGNSDSILTSPETVSAEANSQSQ